MKLHVCCGSVYLDGYINVDIQGICSKNIPKSHKTTFNNYYKYSLGSIPSKSRGNFLVDENWDILRKWPYTSDIISEVIMIQAIEHFLIEDAEFIICEIYRVLKKGGIFLFDFPDIKETVLRYEACDFEMMNRLIYCHSLDKYSVHKRCYNEKSFTTLLNKNHRVWTSLEFRQIIKHDYPVIGGITIK